MASTSFNQEISIGGRIVSEGGPVFVIAEAGINHNGDLALAKKLVDAAKAAGADAVKFQTFIAEEEVTRKLQKVEYQKEGEADQESYFDMIKKWEFSEAQWQELVAYCTRAGIMFLSTPSEEVSARLLERLGVSAYKIGSNDLVTIPMLEEIFLWHKPVILSTGMAMPDEIGDALNAAQAAGNRDVIVLHCTSSYPTPAHELNLRAIQTLHSAFGTLVGFSDHSAGLVAAPLAVLLGATVVETHMTLDKTLPGPDQRMALDPVEFKTLVDAIRTAEGVPQSEREAAIQKVPDTAVMLGTGVKTPTSAEMEMRLATRKGIVARRTIQKGEVITRDMLAYKRPYEGLPAKDYGQLVGRRTQQQIEQDEFITMGMLA